MTTLIGLERPSAAVVSLPQSLEAAAPGWTVVDLTGSWKASRWLEFHAGIFNLGDEKYWRWLDVARLEVTDPMIPILSRPGRNFSLSARFSF